MDFGILWEMQLGERPWPEGADRKVYWDAIEQAKLAERLGYSHLWSVEHHFLTGYSHSSAPEVWLSAVAQHTSTIRIGHGVVLLPPAFNPTFHVTERGSTPATPAACGRRRCTRSRRCGARSPTRAATGST